MRAPLDPAELVGPGNQDSAALRRRLFEKLIPIVIHSRRPADRKYSTLAERTSRPRHSYRAEDVRRWLTTIATDLRNNRTRDWLWWQLGSYTFGTAASARTLKWGSGAIMSTLYCWFLAVPLDLGLPLASSITAAWLVLYSIFGGPDMTPRHLNLDFRRHHGRVLRRFVGPTLGSSVAATGLALTVFAYLYYLADSPDLRLPRYLRDVDFVLLASGAVLIAIAVGGMYDLLRDLDPTDTGARAPLASYQQSKLVMILVLTALLACGSSCSC